MKLFKQLIARTQAVQEFKDVVTKRECALTELKKLQDMQQKLLQK